MSDEPATHLIILRACDADVEGSYAQAKVGHAGEPSEDVLREYRDGITDMYAKAFSRAPDRVGIAVLPWVGEEDDDDLRDPDEAA